MSEDRVQRLLAQIRITKDVIEGKDHPSIPRPFVYRCTVGSSVSWDKRKIEDTLQVVLPDDLIHLWNYAADVRLHEDVSYGQWGLVIWSPEEVFTKHPYTITERREEDIRKGDLIIGELIGDSEFIILRCDPDMDDYGKLLVALLMDPRRDWPIVALSLAEFLERAMTSVEYKYWSHNRK